jgi:hypothetical protein
MKMACFFLIVLNFAASMAFAKNDKWNEFKIDKLSFYVNSNANIIEKDKFEKQLRLIGSILDSCKAIKYQTRIKLTSDFKDSISITNNNPRGDIEYHSITGRNFRFAAMDSKNMIRSIAFPINERSLTKEENKNYSQTRKIPDTFKNISEEDAIAIAKRFHLAVYGKEENSKFDTLSLSNSHSSYFVKFKIKQKNEILDTRSSIITVNANTGEIESFTGEGLSDIDLNYSPKFTKSQALVMYKDVSDRLNATITIRTMGLSKISKKKDGKSRWAWLIYGDRKDKYLGTSAMMFIDSETGEVLFNKMDY